MRTNFTAEIRVLLCEGCGAPLEVPIGGGQTACTYCRAANVVQMRDERPTLGMPAVPQPIDEAERMRRLRMQDGRPLVPPPSLVSLIGSGNIEPWRVQEVFSVFQATRHEVKTTRSPDAAERLFFLTLVIANHLAGAREDARLRAVLETALDTLELPRHRQTIRGMLSRNAVRELDAVAAERWLAPCDPRSDDLQSDSSYRVSRALIDTARQDYRAVIALLGPSEADVPIVDAMDSSAAVLRANALERMGDLAGAERVLRERMAKAGPNGREAMEAFAKLTPTLRLCEQSLPRATMAHTEQAASRAGGGMRTLGIVMIVMGGLLLAIGTAMGVVLGGALAALQQGSLGGAALPGMMGGIVGGAGGPGVAGLIMVAVGLWMLRSGASAAELRRIGLRARGTVIGIQPTGMRINNVPVFALQLRVEREGAPPYEATLRHRMYGHEIAVGSEVPLRVHPQKPTEMILELD